MALGVVMDETDKARCWDALKAACFEIMQDKKVFGFRIETEKGRMAKSLMGILTHVEMTIGKKRT